MTKIVHELIKILFLFLIPETLWSPSSFITGVMGLACCWWASKTKTQDSSVISDQALQPLETRRLWCGGNERICRNAVSCTLGHNHHSPSDSLVSMIGFAEMVSLVYVVVVVITELSVHALSSWTQQSLGFFRVLPSVACWLFPLLSIWSVDVSSSVRRCLLFLVLNYLKCLDLCRYSCSSYWSYLLCTLEE